MIEYVILAGGKGKRMNTEKPKALVEAKGLPMIQYVLNTLLKLGHHKPHIVIGHKAEEMKEKLGPDFPYVLQVEQKGTGHAVMCANEMLKDKDLTELVVLFADQPLIRPESIQKLIETRRTSGAVFSMATACPPHHEGDFKVFERMGRIIRDKDGVIEAIVEYKDATDEIRAVKEINWSVYCFEPKWLWENLPKLQNANASGEYYLTDLVKIAREQGRIVVPLVTDTIEAMGANTPEELVLVEKYL